MAGSAAKDLYLKEIKKKKTMKTKQKKEERTDREKETAKTPEETPKGDSCCASPSLAPTLAFYFFCTRGLGFRVY